MATSLSYFLAYASTSVVARRFGARQPREAMADGINYITLGLILGLGVGLLMWLQAGTFTRWIGLSAEALPQAVEWLHGAALGAPAAMATMAAVGLFRGLQDTRVTLYVTGFQVGINMVCLGNICLSPAAAVLRHKLVLAHLDHMVVDSAGLNAYL